MTFFKRTSLAVLMAIAFALSASAKNIDVTKFERFAQSVDSAMGFADASLLNERLDVKGILGKAMESIQLEESLRKDAIDGAMRKFDFGQMVLGSVGESGNYSFLRISQEKGDVRALFRLRTSDFRLNYHELVLEEREGQIMVADVYVHLLGETLSESFGNVFAGLFGSIDPSKSRKTDKADMTRIEDFMEAKKARSYDVAYTKFAKLPKEMKQSKSVLMHYVEVASFLSEKKHLKAVAQYEKQFPGDPSLDLLLLDTYFTSQKYAEALASVEKIDKAVGGDDFLKFYKSTIYSAKGDFENSRKLCDELIKEGDFMYLAYVNLININYMEKNYAALLDNLLFLKDILNIQPEEIVETASIPDFFHSDAWTVWVEANRRN